MATLTNPHSDISTSLQAEVENIDAAPPWTAHAAADEVMRRLGMTRSYPSTRYGNHTTTSGPDGHVDKYDSGTARVCVYLSESHISFRIVCGHVERFIRLVEFARKLEQEAGGE